MSFSTFFKPVLGQKCHFRMARCMSLFPLKNRLSNITPGNSTILLSTISPLQNHPEFLRPPCLKKNGTSCDGDEMKTNYNTLRMPDLRALMRERELRGYSRLRKAELITFLRDNLRPMPPLRPSSKPIPAPRPPSKHIPALRPLSKPMLALRLPQSVKLQPKCIKPPKPMRLPPPPPENSFNPY